LNVASRRLRRSAPGSKRASAVEFTQGDAIARRR
jgi:hypothetical protein